MAQIQWFPGHMAKTLRELKERLNLCDAVIELCDARMPASSRNDELGRLLQNKRRLLVLSKEDLADPLMTRQWLEHYRREGQAALAGDMRNKAFIQQLRSQILTINQDILERARARGRITRPLRLLVAGIPNCGKSTLINSLCGRHSAETSNRPGVTRSLSWLKAGSELQLLDSPGLLWPKLESRHEQIALGACAAIKDEIMPLEDLAGELLLLLCERYPELTEKRYSLPEPEAELERHEKGTILLAALGERLTLIGKGGEPDLPRTARRLLKSFRDGEIGRISLENPKEN